MREYLNSWEILSQCFLNKYVIFLVLATVRFFITMQSLSRNMETYRATAMILCQEVQNARSNVEQAQRQSAHVIAVLANDFAQQMWKAARLSLLALVTVIKSIITFFIEIYLGTLTCLLTATIKGVLDLIADILREITHAVESVVNTFIEKFEEALSSVSSVINAIISGVDAIKSLFSESGHLSDQVTKLNLTISTLHDIHISTQYTTKIEALADEIPDFSQLLTNVTDILVSPLTKFSTHLETNFSVPNITFNLAKDEPSSAACSSLDLLVSHAIEDFQTSTKICTISLFTSTFLVIVVSVVLSYFRNKSFSTLLQELSFRDGPVEIGNSLQSYKYGVFRYLIRNLKPRTLWLISFMTTSNLSVVLSVVIIGAVTALIQACLISKVDAQLSNIPGDLATSNSTFTSSFLHSFIDEVQETVNNSTMMINKTVLGGVHSYSTELVDGITTFQNALNDTIFSVFGTSFLSEPFETIVYCTLGRKVDTIKKGVVWIQNNTTINPPVISSQELLKQISDDYNSHTDTVVEIVSALRKMLLAQKKSIFVECYMSAVFLAIWMIYLISGVAIAFHRERNRVISWPSQMSPGAQRKYQYPFDNSGKIRSL